MKSLSRENQADIIEAFNSTSRYLDDLLNIDNIFHKWVGLDALSLAWPAVVQLVVFFNSGSQWVLPRVLVFVSSQ